jgi:hypothetical protein
MQTERLLIYISGKRKSNLKTKGDSNAFLRLLHCVFKRFIVSFYGFINVGR